MNDITPISRGIMILYNHSEIVTHRTYLTYDIATVDVHHILSSIVQFVKCQLIVSISRKYINDADIC